MVERLELGLLHLGESARHLTAHQRFQERVQILEVLVDEAAGHARGLGDRFDRQPVEAVIDHDRSRRVEQLVAAGGRGHARGRGHRSQATRLGPIDSPEWPRHDGWVEIAPPDEAVPGLHDVLGRRVFAVGDVDFRWEDVLAAAKESEEWPRLEARAAEGAACERRAEAEGDPLDASEAGSAANAFRYERNLLSARGAGSLARALGPRTWIDGWGSSAATLWRERWSDDLHDTAARFPPPAEEVHGALWVDMVCSGHAASGLPRTLASRGRRTRSGREVEAATVTLGSRSPFVTSASGRSRREALEHLLATREMDWLMVEFRALTLPEEGMAREAALCVRDDGMSLYRVAEQAGAAARGRPRVPRGHRGLRWTTCSSSCWGGRDAGSDRGRCEGFSLVSSWPRRDRLWRTRPSARARRSEVVNRAVEQEVINRVRWHERL